jgi:hypothetical protein
MIEAETMPKTTREPVPKPPPDYPPEGPLGDLLAAEAIVDLVRIAVEQDFLGDRLECRQESAAIAAGHALRLVRRARLAYAEALAVAVSSRAAAAVPETKRAARRG